MWRHEHAKLRHSTLSKLGTISSKSGTLRVKMSYSEVGPSNGQTSKRLIDTGLNHSGSIPIWSGDLHYKIWPYAGQSQLDAKIEYSWNFSTFLTCIGACRQATIKDMDFMFPVRTLPSLSYRPRKYKGMDMLSWSTVVCHIWGQFRWNLILYGSKCPILKRVHQTARSPNGLWIQGWILQGRFQYDRATEI